MVNIKLIDFGLTSRLESARTLMVGTPGMSLAWAPTLRDTVALALRGCVTNTLTHAPGRLVCTHSHPTPLLNSPPMLYVGVRVYINAPTHPQYYSQP